MQRRLERGVRRRATMRCGRLLTAAVLAVFAAGGARAGVFPYPGGAGNMVGRVRVVTARADDTLLDIARHYDVGYNEIVAANPGVDPWLPGAGARVVVPTEYILPARPWKGIVIDLPERRLFYFPPVTARHPIPHVYTFPVGIFQPGWPDPLGTTRIVAKRRMPHWVVPADIRAQAAAAGDPLPRVVPPGPQNPMGELALETGFPEIYIHGTSRPWGVGRRPSHGCFHLYPEDAVTLFRAVAVGTPVRIVDRPYRIGQRSGLRLYLERFTPLRAYHRHGLPGMQAAIDAVTRYMARTGQRWTVDWGRVQRIVAREDPIPTPISQGSPPLARLLAALPARPYRYPPYGTDANDATPPPARIAAADSEHP